MRLEIKVASNVNGWSGQSIQSDWSAVSSHLLGLK
jgi:hypothetical protein